VPWPLLLFHLDVVDPELHCYCFVLVDSHVGDVTVMTLFPRNVPQWRPLIRLTRPIDLIITVRFPLLLLPVGCWWPNLIYVGDYYQLLLFAVVVVVAGSADLHSIVASLNLRSLRPHAWPHWQPNSHWHYIVFWPDLKCNWAWPSHSIVCDPDPIDDIWPLAITLFNDLVLQTDLVTEANWMGDPFHWFIILSIIVTYPTVGIYIAVVDLTFVDRPGGHYHYLMMVLLLQTIPITFDRCCGDIVPLHWYRKRPLIYPCSRLMTTVLLPWLLFPFAQTNPTGTIQVRCCCDIVFCCYGDCYSYWLHYITIDWNCYRWLLIRYIIVLLVLLLLLWPIVICSLFLLLLLGYGIVVVIYWRLTDLLTADPDLLLLLLFRYPITALTFVPAYPQVPIIRRWLWRWWLIDAPVLLLFVRWFDITVTIPNCSFETHWWCHVVVTFVAVTPTQYPNGTLLWTRVNVAFPLIPIVRYDCYIDLLLPLLFHCCCCCCCGDCWYYRCCSVVIVMTLTAPYQYPILLLLLLLTLTLLWYCCYWWFIYYWTLMTIIVDVIHCSWHCYCLTIVVLPGGVDDIVTSYGDPIVTSIAWPLLDCYRVVTIYLPFGPTTLRWPLTLITIYILPICYVLFPRPDTLNPTLLLLLRWVYPVDTVDYLRSPRLRCVTRCCWLHPITLRCGYVVDVAVVEPVLGYVGDALLLLTLFLFIPVAFVVICCDDHPIVDGFPFDTLPLITMPLIVGVIVPLRYVDIWLTIYDYTPLLRRRLFRRYIPAPFCCLLTADVPFVCWPAPMTLLHCWFVVALRCCCCCTFLATLTPFYIVEVDCCPLPTLLLFPCWLRCSRCCVVVVVVVVGWTVDLIVVTTLLLCVTLRWRVPFIRYYPLPLLLRYALWYYVCVVAGLLLFVGRCTLRCSIWPYVAGDCWLWVTHWLVASWYVVDHCLLPCYWRCYCWQLPLCHCCCWFTLLFILLFNYPIVALLLRLILRWRLLPYIICWFVVIRCCCYIDVYDHCCCCDCCCCWLPLRCCCVVVDVVTPCCTLPRCCYTFTLRYALLLTLLLRCSRYPIWCRWWFTDYAGGCDGITVAFAFICYSPFVVGICYLLFDPRCCLHSFSPLLRWLRCCSHWPMTVFVLRRCCSLLLLGVPVYVWPCPFPVVTLLDVDRLSVVTIASRCWRVIWRWPCCYVVVTLLLLRLLLITLTLYRSSSLLLIRCPGWFTFPLLFVDLLLLTWLFVVDGIPDCCWRWYVYVVGVVVVDYVVVTLLLRCVAVDRCCCLRCRYVVVDCGIDVFLWLLRWRWLI